jgi:hypothetical protein
MWTNVCVEGYCFGGEKDGKYPCGRDCPSDLCLVNGCCPHFSYSYTSERDVAQFVPLWKILIDRIGVWDESLYWKLRWWLWDSLWFNQKKDREFLNSIGSVTSEECPELKEWEDGEKKCQEDFIGWFEKARRDYATQERVVKENNLI